MRMKTQVKAKASFKSKIMNRSRETTSTKQKRKSDQELRRKTSPNKGKKLLKHQLSLLEVKQYKKGERLNKSKKKRLFQDRQQYPAKYDVINRQRINTYTSGQMQSKQLTKTEGSHCSKSRLLHSSFYLYKLNQRHQLQTSKNLKRQQTQQQN